MTTKKPGRPTTEAALKKMGFEVIAFDKGTHHAQLVYEGRRTAMKGESAKELLEVAKGWLEHISSTSR